MNTSFARIGVAGLMIASVACFGALFLRQREAELRQWEKNLQDELATNARQRRALRLTQAKATPTAATIAATLTAAPSATAPSPPPTNLAQGSRLADALAALPEYAPFEQRRARRTNLRRYGALLAELKLTPEREEALKQIFDRMSVQGGQLLRDTYRQGRDTLSPEHEKALYQRVSEEKSAIRALLTADEWAVYERYEKSILWRTARQPELDEFVADRGLPPFTPAQKQALADANCAVRYWRPDPAEGQLTNVAQARRRYEHMAQLAAAALDPKQRAVLADYLAFDHARGEIMGRLFYPDKPAGSIVVSTSFQRP